MAFLSNIQLFSMGFKKLGDNVKISDKASFYNTANISIGSNSRIDDFAIISAGSGGIEIGKYVHVACYASMIGAEKISIGDFCSVAAYCNILSSSDEYSGEYLMNPCIPIDKRKVYNLPVTMKDYSIIAAKCMVMPGVTIGENACLGAFSFTKNNIPDNEMWVGIPAKYLKKRLKVKEAIEL